MDGGRPWPLNRAVDSQEDGVSDQTEGQAPTLRKAREARRMTQAHLAQAAGVSARTVMRAENGDDVSPESLRAIFSVLRLDAEAVEPAPGTPAPDASPPVAKERRPYDDIAALRTLMLAVCGLMFSVAVLSGVIPALVLPQAYARHISYPEAIGARKALQVAGTLSKPMDALSGEVESTALQVEDDWSIAAVEGFGWRLQDCDDSVFWNMFFGYPDSTVEIRLGSLALA